MGRRAKWCGYAFAQVSYMHGAPPERKFVKEMRRTILWGGIVPSIALILALPTHGLSLLLFGRYPLTTLRTIYGIWLRGFSWLDSLAWGVSCSVSVFAEVTGVMKFHLDRLRHKQFEIIEYKGPQTPALKV
jgi:hypothetical protein